MTIHLARGTETAAEARNHRRAETTGSPPRLPDQPRWGSLHPGDAEQHRLTSAASGARVVPVTRVTSGAWFWHSRQLRGAACLSLLVASAWLGSLRPALATPPGDPICGSPSSQALVSAIRAQRLAETRARRGSIRPQGPETPPQLALERPGPFDFPRLILQGGPGQIHDLETTLDLATPQWSPWLSVVLGDQPLTWQDSLLGPEPSRFYRLRARGADAPEEPVSNFRLLDAAGVAHDLYYHTHLAAVAVLAAGSNLDQIAASAPLLANLGRTYTNRVETWILLSDPTPVRSNVLAQAKALGIASAVLLDPDGIAARSVGLTRAGEVALIRTPAFTTAYRGEAGGEAGTSPGESLLGRALAGVVSNAPVTYLRTPAHGPTLALASVETPNYTRDIAPVLYEYCAKCHRPGGVAPFAMTSHQVVADWAPSIAHALRSNKMPPWHADPEYGHFANDLSLPGPLKATLLRWLDAGAPRGDGADPLADLPPPPAFDRWPEELGEPDALVTIPIQPVKADGAEPYRYIFTQTPNPTNVWLKAAIVRPSNYKAVHHYLVWLGHIGNSGTTDNSSYESHIAEFVPGYEPFRLPPDAGIFLARSNKITFNLHYTPYGVETTDEPVLALWYHKEKPPKRWVAGNVGNGTFSIPPQARDHPVQAEWTLPNAITLQRMNPHMHVRGKRVKYEAFYPDGHRELLLSVPDYDFNWQIGYALAEPRLLPAGTRLVVSGAFDNSPQNLANPDPTARVRWGDQSWMEMFVGFLDYTQ